MLQSPAQTYTARQSPSQTMEEIVAGPDITMSVTGSNGDQKPRKMRASCDACSRAKVKCDKIRPTCQRCGNMSICCNYSPSMRLGKPRKHRNPDGIIKREVSPAGSYGSLGHKMEIIPRTTSYACESSPEPTDSFHFGPSTPEFHYQDAFVRNTFNGNQSPPCSEGAGSLVNAWSNNENMMFGNQTHMFAPVPQYLPQHTAYHGHVRSTSSQSQPDMYTSLELQQPSPETSQHFLGGPDDLFASEEQALDSPPLMGPAPLPTPPASTGRASHNCTPFAFQILNSLYTPHETQANVSEFTSSVNGSPTLESVLSANKTAVERLHALLNCECTSDPHFSAVVNLAITKVLSWYQAIARAHSHRKFSSSEILTEAFMQPSTGPSTLESEVESTYRTNVVLSELPKIEKLIDRFSERYSRAANEAETGIGGGVYLLMEASLRISVRETFKITMSAAPEAVRRQMASRTNNRMRVNTV